MKELIFKSWRGGGIYMKVSLIIQVGGDRYVNFLRQRRIVACDLRVSLKAVSTYPFCNESALCCSKVLQSSYQVL